jgi:hypothetical protein
MEFSNRALAILLVAAMVISLGGTLISLNRMNQVTTVGFASTATGQVNLTIGSTLSITSADNPSIDFGSCNVSGVGGFVDFVDSENATGNYTNRCTGGSLAGSVNGSYDNITVRNIGNSNAVINITFDACAPGNGNTSCTFLNSSTQGAQLLYRTVSGGSGSYTGGCTGAVGTYTAASCDGPISGCATLAYGASANSMVTHIKIGIPTDAPTGTSTVNITYSAS